MQTAKQNTELLKNLRWHIGMVLKVEETADKSLDIKIRIAGIDAEFKKMLNAVSEGNIENLNEEQASKMMSENQRSVVQLEQCANIRHKSESAKSRLDQIFTILDRIQNYPIEYDGRIVRQILECVLVESKEQIKIVFIGGLEVTEPMD